MMETLRGPRCIYYKARMFSVFRYDGCKSIYDYTLKHSNKISSLGKNKHITITPTNCKTEFRENIFLKIAWPVVRLLKYGE